MTDEADLWTNKTPEEILADILALVDIFASPNPPSHVDDKRLVKLLPIRVPPIADQ